MIINRALNRRFNEGASELVHDGRDRVKAYLSMRWQQMFEELSLKNNEALIMYMAIKEKAYEIHIANKQAQTHYNSEEALESKGSDFIDLVRKSGELMMVEDSRKDVRLTGAREMLLGYRTLIGTPIFDHHSFLKGVLLVMEQTPRTIDQDYLKSISWLAASIEESIRYLGVEDEISAIRNIDPLTRLVSRDKMMSKLKLEFERSQRSGMPFSVVMIDIDDFRHINESFGHDTGDAVLREFSEEIASRVRMVDTASRWDGDAFLVMCPHTDLLGANALVNDLFSNLTHHVFPNVGRCYFSMGIADYATSDTSINDLLIRLDKALYRVKAFGGNSHKTKYH